jgi:hypothetical protein
MYDVAICVHVLVCCILYVQVLFENSPVFEIKSLKKILIYIRKCGAMVQHWIVMLRWYAQSESIIIKTHSKTIVLQDYRFYLLVFFLSLLLFTVPRCKTIVLKDSRIFLLVFL